MKSSVKYNFDIAFDGGHSDSVMQIKMFYEKKLEDIKIEFEDLGFSKGYSYAISGIENNKMESLKNIEKFRKLPFVGFLNESSLVISPSSFKTNANSLASIYPELS